jgi:hypothetical protein
MIYYGRSNVHINQTEFGWMCSQVRLQGDLGKVDRREILSNDGYQRAIKR